MKYMKNKKLILCVSVLFCTLLVVAYNILTKPKAIRGRLPSMAPAATVYQVKKGSVPIYIDTIATLVPYQSIALKSKVSGTVESLAKNFEAGAIVKKKAVLLSLEKRNFENEVRKLKASLAKVKADHTLELGHQLIVQEELKQLEGMMADDILSSSLHTELTLRRPQLEQVLSDLSIAEVNLLNAQYDLEETEVKAPFDALILSRTASVGQHISASETLAELVSVEKYLADVAIPVDTLYNNQLLTHKSTDIPIEVITNFNEKWEGKLEHIVSALTTESRMGKMIISIEDPLALQDNNTKVPLLLGDQVNVRILAGTYDDVIQLPRSAVFNNENIWLLNKENHLKYQKIEIVWSDGNNVFVKENVLKDNDLVLHSGISNPVEDLLIKPTIINISEEEKVKQEEMQKKRMQKIKEMQKLKENNSDDSAKQFPSENSRGPRMGGSRSMGRE